MLWLSWISVPAAVGTSVAWRREASRSWITMSLSVARPMLTDPGGGSAEPLGRPILRKLVARSDVASWRGAGPLEVVCKLAGCAALDTAEAAGPSAEPWRPTSKVKSGPTRLPTLMFRPSSMSTAGTRRPCTNIPLRLSLSTATHRPCSNRSSKCAREINVSAMRKSARMSRPTTTSSPATNACADPSYRTVSSGAATWVIERPRRPIGVANCGPHTDTPQRWQCPIRRRPGKHGWRSLRGWRPRRSRSCEAKQSRLSGGLLFGGCDQRRLEISPPDVRDHRIGCPACRYRSRPPTMTERPRRDAIRMRPPSCCAGWIFEVPEEVRPGGFPRENLCDLRPSAAHDLRGLAQEPGLLHRRRIRPRTERLMRRRSRKSRLFGTAVGYPRTQIAGVGLEIVKHLAVGDIAPLTARVPLVCLDVRDSARHRTSSARPGSAPGGNADRRPDNLRAQARNSRRRPLPRHGRALHTLEPLSR